jgi:uncharacterized protein YggE
MFCAFPRRSLLLAIAWMIVAGLLALPRAAMADDSAGISVTGAGQAQTRPSTVEIDGTVSGDGELAADAMVKYRDTKKKALAAIDALKIPGLTVESQGPALTQANDPNAQMRMMQGMAADNTKSKVHVAENLKLLIKQADTIDSAKLLDTVLKVLDAARDAGLQVGPPPPANYYEMQIRAQSGESGDGLATFVIPDTTALRDDAYQKAMDDARTKAQRLAQLSGVKLGPVISVSDDGSGTNSNSRANLFAMMEGMATPQAGLTKEAKSGTLHEIQITVQLSVRFAILPADQK